MSMFLIDAVFAAIAGLGFSYANKPPRRILLFCTMLGGFGYSLRVIFMNYLSYTISTFISAICISFVAVFLARKVKTPIEIIAFPSLLPMIPGLYAYKAMLAMFLFIQTNVENKKSHYLVEIFDYGSTAVSAIFALAVGVSVVILIFYEKSFTMTRNKDFKKRYLG